MISATAFVHPLAHVEASCEVRDDAKIWQFATATRGAIIGAGVSLAPHAMVDGSIVRAGSKIGPGVKMGPGFILGQNVFLGPNVVLCNDLWPRADVTGFEIDKLLDGSIVAIRIEDGASVGANAVVLPGVRIGAGAMIAAGAVCDRSVPPRMLFRRDGTMVEINTAWTRRRMRGVR
jgi:acetyltransferase-like isoleucine patch superfamily enzyme